MTDSVLCVDDATEWIETDGLGGFASGTTSGIRTRRYHALLLAAAAPPADRRALVAGFVACLDTPDGSAEFWPQAYAGGLERVVLAPQLERAGVSSMANGRVTVTTETR